MKFLEQNIFLFLYENPLVNFFATNADQLLLVDVIAIFSDIFWKKMREIYLKIRKESENQWKLPIFEKLFETQILIKSRTKTAHNNVLVSLIAPKELKFK